jgi:hypothetical protein
LLVVEMKLQPLWRNGVANPRKKKGDISF